MVQMKLSSKLKVIVSALVTFIVLSVLFVILLDQVIMPIVVRKGEEVVVPNVVGLSQEEALSQLEAKGLRAYFAGKKHSEFPPNAIAEQDPEGGMIVKKGFRVALFLSSGPPDTTELENQEEVPQP